MRADEHCLADQTRLLGPCQTVIILDLYYFN